MDFAQSQRSSIGIEWEIALVDRETRELAPHGADIVRELDDERAMPEFMTNTVEIVTGVRESVSESMGELLGLRDRIIALADERGAAPIGPGTHPFSDWREQEVTPGDRYERVIDRSGIWGRQLAIWGVHAHVGVEDRSKVAPLLRSTADAAGVILALSASSPYWIGEDTGFASHRTMVFRQLPTCGHPPEFSTWADYEGIVEDHLVAGIVTEPSEIRWDVRPAPHLGTIEVRIADGATRPRDLAAITALVHCLVEEASRRLDADGDDAGARHLPTWFLRDNTRRAARYGTDASLITSPDGDERAVRDLAPELVERLEPIAHDLKCWNELANLPALAEENAADRQRAVAAEHDGDLRAVVDELIEDFRS